MKQGRAGWRPRRPTFVWTPVSVCTQHTASPGSLLRRSRQSTTSLSAPPVATKPVTLTSIESTGSLPCHAICGVIALQGAAGGMASGEGWCGGKQVRMLHVYVRRLHTASSSAEACHVIRQRTSSANLDFATKMASPARPSPLRPAAAVAAISPPLPVETECTAGVPPPVSVGSSDGGSCKRFRSSLVSDESSAVASRPASRLTPRPPPVRTRGSFGTSPQPPPSHPPDAAAPASRQGKRPPPIHTKSSFGPLDRDSPDCMAFPVVAGHREHSLGCSSNDGSSPRQARQDPDPDPDP